MDNVLIGVGIAGIIAGYFIKPEGARLEWSRMWSWATNSTPEGKAVFLIGGLVTALGVYLKMG